MWLLKIPKTLHVVNKLLFITICSCTGGVMGISFYYNEVVVTH